MRSWTAQLRKGIVELCVVASLRDGEAYGYQLLQSLAAVEGLAASESTVYPILARLTKEGVLSVRTAPSPAGPPRRYYRLTKIGHERLNEMAACWDHLMGGVRNLLNHGASS